MRTSLTLAAVAALLLALGSTGVATARSTPAAQLAKMLDGRAAGEPVDCLRLNDIRSSRIIDGIAIVYEGRNGTYYVNAPASGASALRDDLTLVTDTHSDQLCSIDIVRLVDMPSHMAGGSVGLGKFIPYARPAKTR